jgi:hypothetical protein
MVQIAKIAELRLIRVQVTEARLDALVQELTVVLGKIAARRVKGERIPEGKLLTLVSGAALLTAMSIRRDELRKQIAEELDTAKEKPRRKAKKCAR